MKVWLFKHQSYGEVAVFSEDTNMLEVERVKRELDYYRTGYPDEIEFFVDCYNRAVKRGYGEAEIEERFTITLVEVIES